MQEELRALQPKWKVAQKETAEKLVVVKNEKEANEMAAAVEKIVRNAFDEGNGARHQGRV